ncbi:shewanella-like protein phosphatase [Nannocystaceae bacterium ST9]
MTRPRFVFAPIALLALLAPGCERLAPPPSQRSEPAPAASSKAGAPAPEADAAPTRHAPSAARLPAPARLVAIGDLHGDIAATRAAFRLAGAIDQDDRWIGGDLVVVQTGDQLDRGDDEQAILELLERLQGEAKAAGGALHVLNGNHEFMNALGDLRYVTPGGFADFADAPGTDIDDPALERALADVPAEARPRLAAFLPGRTWAKKLADQPVILIVGDSVFAHGGILPSWAKVGPETINAEAEAFLLGEREQPPEAIVDPEGPVWTRAYSANPDAAACAMLDETLEILGVERMVVGHTVHTEGVTSACEGKVWMVDVGLAKYYGGPVEVLEIRGDAVRVIGG